ncbi:formate dehydrogenase subunit delta [Azospirillaceae bacterium]
MTETEETSPQLDKLARMANQIAAFFAAYPDEQAALAVAEHINLNWSRVMRTQFLEGFDARSSVFHPLVAQAYGKIRRPVAALASDQMK